MRRNPVFVAGLWCYPFPLAKGGTAYLYLPPQLTRNDVERLGEMLRSLIIEPEPEVPALLADVDPDELGQAFDAGRAPKAPQGDNDA